MAFGFVQPLPATTEGRQFLSCSRRYTRGNSGITWKSAPLRWSAFLGNDVRRGRVVPCRPYIGLQMSIGKAVVAGGTGFIGSRLVKALVDKGTSVTVLTRSASSASHLPKDVTVQTWAPDKLKAVGQDWLNWENSLKGADLVVNLCGTPIVAKWDEDGKRSIVESRLKATQALVDAIKALPVEDRPKCVVSPSAVGYYGVSDNAQFNEQASLARNDFLASVCEQWEAAAAPLRNLEGVRLVTVRIGVVMGLGGGAMARMLPFFQFFLGGPIGRGSQWVSWIHIDDLVNMFITAGESDTMTGVYNGTAPNPVTMSELSASLARALNRPNLFPVPGVLLKLVFGPAADVVLEGQRVLPEHWLADGHTFKYGTIDAAMSAIAKEL